jgi:protein SCO1/2
MKRVKSFKKTIILALILASPGFCYYLLTEQGKNRYKPLPIYGSKVLTGTVSKVMGKEVPDTLYHQLQDFRLRDQNGEEVTLDNFDKSIFITGFFYTNCASVCELMLQNLSKVAANYKKNDMVKFVSITVDPDRDSVYALKAYSQKYEATDKQWQFLTGDTSTIYNLARNGFLVNAVAGKADDFIYSEQFMLVDTHKRIRGYYNGTSKEDMVRLNDEIKVLIAEELRDKKIPDSSD